MVSGSQDAAGHEQVAEVGTDFVGGFRLSVHGPEDLEHVARQLNDRSVWSVATNMG